MYRIMSFEEVAEYVYHILSEHKNTLPIPIKAYSDFDVNRLEEENMGNAIGITTVNIFNEPCMLAIGVYGEAFTDTLCLDTNYDFREVRRFIVQWLNEMELQLCNNMLAVNIREMK